MKFPVIRVQPGFRRVGLSAAISYPIYSYVSSIGDEMKIKRSNNIKIKSKLLTENN